MKKIKKTKKLEIKASKVRMLQHQDLTQEQLKAMVGGMGCRTTSTLSGTTAEEGC
jgi:hypothetical protein